MAPHAEEVPSIVPATRVSKEAEDEVASAVRPIPGNGELFEGRPGIDVVSQEMNALREFQAASIDSLDTKAGVLLGFLGTALTILAGRSSGEIPGWHTAALFVICAGILAAVFALLVRGYRFDPKPEVLKRDYMYRLPDAPGTGAKEQLLADKIDAYEKNERSLNFKGYFVNAAAVCLGLGVILAAVPTLVGGVMSKTNNQTSTSVMPVPPAQPNPAAQNPMKKGAK